MVIRLKELRNKRSLSQKDIGKILNKGKNTISRYETGVRQLDYESIQILCKYFNVTSDYLLGITDTLPEQYLSADEQELLSIYRKCDHKTKLMIKNIMLANISKTNQ